MKEMNSVNKCKAEKENKRKNSFYDFAEIGQS